MVDSLGFVELTSGRRVRVLSFLTSLISISLSIPPSSAPFVLVNDSSGSFSEEGN